MIRDPQRHTFVTKLGLGMTLATLALLGLLSVLYGGEDAMWERQQQQQQHKRNNAREVLDSVHHNFVNESPYSDNTSPTIISQRHLLQDDNNNNNNNNDYTSASCSDLIPNKVADACSYARTCNGGDGLWGGWVFCWASSSRGRTVLILFLSPLLITYLVLLFRMLGSTAEDYFSPALEMLALRLRLPPRFAGVSLLALGNGAADVSATVSAIKVDPVQGYQLALGALTGAAMVIGAVVSALVVLVAEGLPCRGALVRDVTALGLAVLLVWQQLGTGEVNGDTVTLFLAFYVVFVLLVLVADIYHRAVVLPRRQAAAAAWERQRQLQAADLHTAQAAAQAGAPNINGSPSTAIPPESHFSHVLTAFSNYDNDDSAGVGSSAGVDSDVLGADQPIRLHGAHGLLDPHTSPTRRVPMTEEDEAAAGYDRFDDEPESAGITVPTFGSAHTSLGWADAWDEAVTEVQRHVGDVWEDVMYNGDLDIVTKYLLVLEFPVTLLRQATVPIPCEGYYNRGVTALSLAVSPFWMAIYLYRGHGIAFGSLFTSFTFLAYVVACVGAGAAVLRYAPPSTVSANNNDSNLPPLWAATPIALYGFCVAATWIDTVADELVGVLAFLGVILKIPGPIVGLTILAWGNSMSDLSADLTMARKGLANMAMTACFAGPLFNILVGLGLGFSSLSALTGETTHAVSLPPSAKTGFLFIALNSLVILITGLGMGQGKIPKKYGYIAVRRLCGIYMVPFVFGTRSQQPVSPCFLAYFASPVNIVFNLLDCLHLVTIFAPRRK